MLRRLLLPLLSAALFASEAASAQTLPAASAAKPVAAAYSHPAARPKALTAREKRAAEAAAKAEAAKATAAAGPAATDAASTSWNGWSNDPQPADSNGPRRPTINVSVAPGMPLNQIGHGVTTDYNGRPLHHEVASTSLSTAR